MKLDFFVRVAREVIGALRSELAKRDKRIKRLEELIDSAEFAGCCGDGDHKYLVCPWCDARARETHNAVEHSSKCRAFSAPGVVRR